MQPGSFDWSCRYQTAASTSQPWPVRSACGGTLTTAITHQHIGFGGSHRFFSPKQMNTLERNALFLPVPSSMIKSHGFSNARQLVTKVN